MVTPGPRSIKSSLCYSREGRGRFTKGAQGAVVPCPVCRPPSRSHNVEVAADMNSLHSLCIKAASRSGARREKALCHPSLQIQASPCRDKGEAQDRSQ